MANKRLWAVGVTVVSVIALSVQAKTETKVAVAHPSVAEILAKNATARGGVNAWRKVQSISMSGTMDAGKVVHHEPKEIPRERGARIEAAKAAKAAEPKMVQVPFLLELKRPRKSRFEIQFQNQTAVQAYDGTNGWKLRPFLGRREIEPYTPTELKLAAAQQELDGPLLDYAAKGNKVDYVGVDTVEKRKAYKLKVTSKDGQVRNVWVDAQTFLDIKIDSDRKLGNKSHTIATYMRDYKAVNGLMIPHLLETSVEGAKGSEKIVVEQVALNPKLDDALFARPKMD